MKYADYILFQFLVCILLPFNPLTSISLFVIGGCIFHCVWLVTCECISTMLVHQYMFYVKDRYLHDHVEKHTALLSVR